MKNLTTLSIVLALAFTATVANADTLSLPDSGTFDDGPVFFSFPEALDSIDSISINLSYADAVTNMQRPLVLLAGPAGSNFVLVDNPQGALDGVYTFVESGGGDPLLGANPTAAGTYNAIQWNLAGPDQNGWLFNFVGTGGTFSNISVEFNSQVVPEPGSALVILGAFGLALVKRRR